MYCIMHIHTIVYTVYRIQCITLNCLVVKYYYNYREMHTTVRRINSTEYV